jgi:hypothetical protein
LGKFWVLGVGEVMEERGNMVLLYLNIRLPENNYVFLSMNFKIHIPLI